jgi:hypothetical protein
MTARSTAPPDVGIADEGALGGPRAVPQLARFFLRGTNGYKVTVLASVEGAGSPVRIVVEDHRGGAEYQVFTKTHPALKNCLLGR